MLQDDLFAKVAEIVPGIRDEEDEEDFDIAAIMAKQQQQAAKIRQEAQQMRSAGYALLDPEWPSLHKHVPVNTHASFVCPCGLCCPGGQISQCVGTRILEPRRRVVQYSPTLLCSQSRVLLSSPAQWHPARRQSSVRQRTIQRTIWTESPVCPP